jgi:hypothetical protein
MTGRTQTLPWRGEGVKTTENKNKGPLARMEGSQARTLMKAQADVTVLLHNVAAHNVNVTGCVCYLTELHYET